LNLPPCRATVKRPALPAIFEKDGFGFFFYSNKHRPIHVPVRRGGGEAVFEAWNQMELRESQGVNHGENRA
jgi:hypothetical protein